MTPLQTIQVIIVVAVISVGQILFKYAATKSASQDAGLLAMLNHFSIIAIIIYGIATFLWIHVLRQVPLTQAYVLMSGTFIIVPAVASLLFGEPYGIRTLVGGLIIVGGVYVANT